MSKCAEAEGYTFKQGDKIEIRTDGYDIDSTKEEIQVNFFDLPPVMREGDIIIIGDNGQLKAVVTEIARTSFQVQVSEAGKACSFDVIKIPGTRIQQLPILTLDDKIDIKEIAQNNSFDYLIVPQVMSGRDIQEVKLLMPPDMQHCQVIAKIDTLDAIQNFESIVKQADGVVLLRNELQMEMEPEKLMIAQKWMT